jgi:CBS domain-containing protein
MESIAFAQPQVNDVSTSREGATMKISSIISGKRVETISASASIHDVVNTLNSHHIGALVVSSDGKRIDGIVSERDVVRAMPGKLDQLIGMHVRDIMTVEVHTCTPDTTVAELMKMMTEHRIRHVPVVDAEGALISIVSIGDVVKNRVGEMESENQALRDYVATGA